MSGSRRTVVTIGNFDGVHLGHQRIIRELVERAAARSLNSVALTFDPHPGVVLVKNPPPLLMTVDDRAKTLMELGVTECVIRKFTPELAATSAETFVREELLGRLGMDSLFIGPTTHIGRNREGTPERLASWAGVLGFELNVVAQLDVAGSIVSSSRIRGEIQNGNVASVANMLGRPLRTKGKVVSGEGRGRTLGYPTANLGEVRTLLPKPGVYATWLKSDSRLLAGVTNVGFRPTFGENLALSVETHLLGFAGTLSGRLVTLDWVERIREEKKFPSVEALKAQIGKDVEAARRILRVSVESGEPE